MFPLAFVAGWLQGHWWGFISRNYVVWPTFLLMNVSTALKGSHFWFLFYLFGPHFELYQSLNRLPIWNSQNCSMFPLAFVAGWLQGHWWGFISRNYVVWPTFLLMNVSTALKGSHFWFLFKCAKCIGLSIGPRQANLVLIAYASSEGSGEPAHPRSLARTSAARSYKQWVKRNLQTESQIPVPSEWLGMRS